MGWFVDFRAEKAERESEQQELRLLAERNLVAALRLGLIDWFQYFEMWRNL